MKHISYLLGLILLLTPLSAFAHATPIEMQPRTGAQISEMPGELSIRFSERLEPGSSLIRVTDGSGARVESAPASVVGDGRELSVPIQGGEGIYTVVWSVVSKDDGHFTRGSYAFSVGSEMAPASANEEVVHIASTREATLMFVEFAGNSILWGLLALFLLSGGNPRLRRIFAILSLSAASLALAGSTGQLILKAGELGSLHQVSFSEAFILYVQTASGSSTVIRGAALVLGGIAAAVYAFRSIRSTVLILAVPLVVFAYFRAVVSHATANPFYPELSIAVNFIHVIEKDLWFGVLLVLCVLLASRIQKVVMPTLVPRALALLSANLAVLAASAGYIVWLHLKSFANLTGTSWGQAFIPLLCTAIVLVVLHVYHVLSLRLRPRFFERFLTFSLSAEMIAALLVVFFSSVVIITSPPLRAESVAYVHKDNEVAITVSSAPYEDGMALVSVEGTRKKPTVILGERDGGLIPVLTKRFEGGYVFPSALVGEHQMTVIVPRENDYDVQATFHPRVGDFDEPSGHGRTLDTFTVVLITIALCGVALAAGLRFVGRIGGSVHMPESYVPAKLVTASLFALVLIMASVALVSRLFENRYEARCIADGNMWHLMQPTRAGMLMSDIVQEGCMWGMGESAYLFADAREYDYLSSLGPAEVLLASDPKTLRAGAPTRLTVALKNADGTPATLLVDMEKYIHMVIVSKDQSVFAHIHPDDDRALTQAEIDTSTFTRTYTFPKAGTYLVSVDYAHGTKLESKQFMLDVAGTPMQDSKTRTFESTGVFDGYNVTMDAGGNVAGSVATLKFSVSKDGKPVTTMQPYLAAVAHISVVKNDLSAFAHTHGEIHTPGAPYLPIVVKDGQIIHSMEAMTAPSTFGPDFEAHVLFPSPGRYTVWAQFRVEDSVIPASFTVDVE